MAAVNQDGNAVCYADKKFISDLEIISASFENDPEDLKFLYHEGRFKIDEALLKEFRKKFGKKLIDEYFG